MHQSLVKRYGWLLPPLALVVLVISLWLPVGFRTTGLVEEWGFYNLGSWGIPLVPASVWNLDHALRPFVALTFGLGYALTPDSFVGLNLVMFATFLGKALSFYALICLLLPKERAFALITAALFIVFPADTITMMLRAVNIHFALFICLVAANILVLYWRTPRWYFLILMWLLLILCLGTYEVSFVFVVFSPLLLLLLEKRISRKFLFVSFLWYLPFFAYMAWYAFGFSHNSNTYQASYLAHVSLGALPDFAYQLAASLAHDLRWHFFEGWRRALTSLQLSPAGVVTGLGIGVFIAVVSMLQMREDRQQAARKSALFLIALAGAGLAIVVVAYLPFAFSRSHSRITERVFYFTAVGAALCITALIYALSKRIRFGKVGFILASSLLLGIATAGMVYQHQYYATWSREQQRLYAGIIETIPGFTRDGATVIVYYDNEPDDLTSAAGYQHPLFLHYDNFLSALIYLYNTQTTNFVVCGPNTYIVDEYFCDRSLQKTPVEDLILLKYFPVTGRVTLLAQIPDELSPLITDESLYNPQLLIDQTAPVPPRAYTALSECFPSARCYFVPIPIDRVFNDFDGLPAKGWRSSEISPDGLSYQWMTMADASLPLPALIPHDYDVQFSVLYTITPEILNSLSFQVNGTNIPLARYVNERGETIFEGVIRSEVLDSTETNLQFAVSSVVTPPGGDVTLGVALDSLQIMPIEPPAPIDDVFNDFDSRLSTESWRSSETTSDGRSFQWTTARDANLALPPLIPDDYLVRIAVYMAMSPEILNSLVFRINGTAIPLTMHVDEQGATVFEGIIRSEALDATTTDLQFSVSSVAIPSGGTTALGIALDRLEIMPAEAS